MAADGVTELPSARLISNELGKIGQPGRDSTVNVLVMQLGQFIDHDLTHTPNNNTDCCGESEDRLEDLCAVQ